MSDSKGRIMIASSGDKCLIKVEGRTTWECSPPLQELANNISSGAYAGIVFDLSACEWMDSTIMGIMAMIGKKTLEARMPQVEMANTSPKIVKLLKELGVDQLFSFTTGASNLPQPTWVATDTSSYSKKKIAKTILDAHETLINLDKSNAPRFQNVVDLLKKDIDEEKK